MQKKLEKYAPISPWLKFKHGHPWKTIQCHNISSPPQVVSPINKSLLASPQLEFGKTIVNEFFFLEKNQITLYKDL
jgi:hypothetical protein